MKAALVCNTCFRMEKAELGRWGEDCAAQFFLDEGYEILHRNHRIGKSEVDLILRKENKLVFAEIKTRREEQPVREEELLTRSKVRALIRAADLFLLRMPENAEIRFDVVLITLAGGNMRLKHIEDAFRDAGDFYDL